jgi:hypothetical protein
VHKGNQVPGPRSRTILDGVEVIREQAARKGTSLGQDGEAAKHRSDLQPVLQFADKVKLFPAES